MLNIEWIIAEKERRERERRERERAEENRLPLYIDDRPPLDTVSEEDYIKFN